MAYCANIYLSNRNPEGCWGTIFCLLRYCFPLFAVMRRPLRVCQRQPGPLLDIIFPSSFLSTSLSSTLHSALQGDFCQACWPCHMPIPSQFFASNCDEQIFMRANDICLFFSWQLRLRLDLCRRCSQFYWSISFEGPWFSSGVLMWASTFFSLLRQMFLSLQNAAVVWAILAKISGFDPSSDVMDPRMLIFFE